MTVLDLTALRLQQQNARQYVHNAIKKGILERPDACAWCGKKGPVEGHHGDYAEPLKVLWLCRSCHKILHSGLVQALRNTKGTYSQNINLETKGAENESK
jgi:hypothetical protein